MTITPAKLAKVQTIKDAFKLAEDEHGQVVDLNGDRVTLSDLTEDPLTIQTETLTELLARHIPPKSWAVPGIIGTGAIILAGHPKAGKSILALTLAIAVATGTPALGRETEQGRVLYLVLDDPDRIVQQRGRQIASTFGSEDIFDNLALSYECPPLTNKGDQALDEWLTAHPDTRLVVIDIFQGIRGSGPRDGNIYSSEYRMMNKLKRLAHKHDAAIMIVHHTRKAEARRVIDEVSGTHGLTGSADTVMVLQRLGGEADGLLYVTGRDVDERPYSLTFDPERSSWELADIPADELTLGETRTRILTYVRKCKPESATPADTARALGMDRELTKKTMRRMLADGLLLTGGRGKYYAEGDA